MVSTLKSELILYRVSHKKYISDVSGYGAKVNGGRWNHVGIPIIYTAENISLAILESSILISKKYWKKQYSYLKITIPKATKIQTLMLSDLKKGWRDHPPSDETKNIGFKWFHSKIAILKIPSVVVPDENNYIINPNHKDFKNFKISKPKPLDIELKNEPGI